MSDKTSDANESGTLGATTVERALKVVGEILDTGGEASLRLADVSRRSAVSVGSLYHHFGSREGLISAARERQFLKSLPSQTKDDVSYLDEASSAEEFLDRFDEVSRAGDEPHRAAGRRRRFEMIGAAARRPGHLGGILGMQTAHLDLIEELVRTIKQRGWLPADADPRAVALLLHAISMGRVLLEIDEEPVSLDDWHRIVRSFLECLIMNQERAAAHRRAS